MRAVAREDGTEKGVRGDGQTRKQVRDLAEVALGPQPRDLSSLSVPDASRAQHGQERKQGACGRVGGGREVGADLLHFAKTLVLTVGCALREPPGLARQEALQHVALRCAHIRGSARQDGERMEERGERQAARGGDRNHTDRPWGGVRRSAGLLYALCGDACEGSV